MCYEKIRLRGKVYVCYTWENQTLRSELISLCVLYMEKSDCEE